MQRLLQEPLFDQGEGILHHAGFKNLDFGANAIEFNLVSNRFYVRRGVKEDIIPKIDGARSQGRHFRPQTKWGDALRDSCAGGSTGRELHDDVALFFDEPHGLAKDLDILRGAPGPVTHMQVYDGCALLPAFIGGRR